MHTFLSCAFCQRACPSLLSQLFRLQPHSHARTPPTRVAQGAHCFCLAENSHTSSRNVIRYTSLEHNTDTRHVHSSSSSTRSTSHPLFSASFNPAQIYDLTSVALWRSPHPSQVRSPSSLLNPRITGVSPKTTSLLNTRICVLPPTEHSVDSAESIVTPPLDADWDDEQLRALLASPLYLQEREENAGRSQVYHSKRQDLTSSSSQDPITTGRLVALFSSKNRLS